MIPLEELKARLDVAIAPGAAVVEAGVLVVQREHLAKVGRFLRDDGVMKLDYLSNLCATDWLAPLNYLEVVYHLYSVELRHGPLVMKCRTADRAADARMPSVTPIWRGAEYQEREAFDLYGVIFDGHPDLRRILMWDELTDFPMRKDYAPPDDFEWEPTPHESVLARAQAHRAATEKARTP